MYNEFSAGIFIKSPPHALICKFGWILYSEYIRLLQRKSPEASPAMIYTLQLIRRSVNSQNYKKNFITHAPP